MPDNLKRKTAISLWILIMILVLIISLIGAFFFFWFWIVFIPLSFLVVIAFQAMSEHFWTPKRECSRCNAPASIYTEYCRNCGLKLIKQCPSCSRFISSDLTICKNCGYQFSAFKIEEKPIEIQIIQKGQALPEKANFCPNCGANLMNEKKVLDFCPLCGGKID